MTYPRSIVLALIIWGIICQTYQWEATNQHLFNASMIYLFLVIPMAFVSHWKLGGHEAQPDLNRLLGSTAWTFVVAQILQLVGYPSAALGGLVVMGGLTAGAIYTYINIYFSNE